MDRPTAAHEILPRALTPAYLERVAREAMRPSVSPIEIEARAEFDTTLLADGHLLGVLSRLLYARRQPRVALSEVNCLDGLDVSATRWLVEAIGGFVLARMSSEARDRAGREILGLIHSAQARHLSESRGVLRGAQFFAYPVVDTYPSLERAKVVDSLLTRGSGEIEHMLNLELSRLGLSSPYPDSLANATRFLVELFENTEVHGNRTLDGNPVAGVRIMSARRWFMRDLSALESDYAEHSAIKNWMALLAARGYDTARIPFVEFTVADCGVGIPAHYTRSLDLYNSKYVEEVAALRDAFRRSSQKESFSGVGLRFALGAIKDLDGFLSVRTGRSFAWRHYIDEKAELEELEIVVDSERTLYGGTAISIIVPWGSVDPALFGVA